MKEGEAGEAKFREHMRTLAERGGAAMKRKADATYYREIGRLGGRASVAARRERFALEEEPTSPSGAPIVKPREAPVSGALAALSATDDQSAIGVPQTRSSAIDDRETAWRTGARDAYRRMHGVDPDESLLDAIANRPNHGWNG